MKEEDIPFLLAAFLDEKSRKRLLERAEGDGAALGAIRDSHRLKHALDRGVIPEGEVDDLLLALLAAEGSGARSEWKTRLREKVEADADAAARLADLETRVRGLEISGSAEAHFDRLAGGRRRRPSRWPLAVAAALVFATIGHGMFKALTEDPLRKHVWSGYLPTDVSRSSVEGGGGGEHLVQAIRLGYEARETTLWLWPRYDREKLRRAVQLLKGTDQASTLLERARLEILLGDVEQARKILHRIGSEGAAATEKDKLLREMERLGR